MLRTTHSSPPRWFARPTFSLLSGEPAVYLRYSDGIIVEGGHLLLRRRHLLRSFGGRIFAVDPRTPALQGKPENAINPRTDKIRTSYLRLAAAHGGPLWRRFSHMQPQAPGDFTRNRCRKIAQRLIDLERTAGPEFIMPAYFHFTHLQDPWIRVNAIMYECFREMAGESSLLLPLAFDHRMLESQDDIDLLCRQLSSLHPAGFAIWPVGLDENRASCEELVALGSLVERLPGPLLMYGGFFSMLLCTLFEGDYSSGPCFYDRRGLEIAPPLEFRPRCRYYIPMIHQKLDPVAAAVLYTTLAGMKEPPRLCPTCQKYVDGCGYDKIAEMPAIDLCHHNFASRRSEMEGLASSLDPRGNAMENLEWLLERKEGFSQFRSLGYAEVWLEALRRMEC